MKCLRERLLMGVYYPRFRYAKNLRGWEAIRALADLRARIYAGTQTEVIGRGALVFHYGGKEISHLSKRRLNYVDKVIENKRLEKLKEMKNG